MEPVTPPESIEDNETAGAPSRPLGDEREDRRNAVWDGMLAGKSYRTMATELGVSAQTVLRDVKVLRRRWQLVADRYEDHARLDLARIEKLINRLWGYAIEGGKGGSPDKFAVDRIIALLDRKARMLGNDRPQRHEHKHQIEAVSTLDVAIEELLAQFPRMPETTAEETVEAPADHGSE